MLETTTHCDRQLNKSWQPRFQTPVLLKAQSRQFFSDFQQSHNVAYVKQPRSQSISCSPNLGYLNSLFCKHDATIRAELVKRAAALRDLTLLVPWGVDDFDFTKWHGLLIDNHLDKHVEQISFRQCVAICEHRQLKGWQPHFQPTIAKSSISTTVHWFAAV